MRYNVARAIFNVMKWVWLGLLVVFVVAYAANIAPLPANQFVKTFSQSVLGWFFHPGLHLALTLIVLGTLLLLTGVAWLIARRAPKDDTMGQPAVAYAPQQMRNRGPAAQVQGGGPTVIVQGGSDIHVAFPTPSEAAKELSAQQHDAVLNGYLDGIISWNRFINPTGISEPASLPLFSVNVPLEEIFVHLRALSDRPRFGMAIEREQLEQEKARLRDRGDLTDDEREEQIQLLRAAFWRSEMVEGMIGAMAKAGQDLKIDDVFEDLTAANPVALLLGGPGAGKSTTMRWLALRMARALRSGAALEPVYAPAQIPLLLRIGDYAAYLVDPERKIPRQTGAEGRPHLFLAFLKQKLAEHDQSLPDIILQALAQGTCLLLLDGLDEVASDDLRRQVAADIYAFLNQHCTKQSARERFNRVIITSRIVGYEPGPLSQYREYTLLDLTDEQIEAFLAHWCPAVERSLAVKGTRSQEESALTAQDRQRWQAAGEQQRDDLLRSLHDNPGIKRLAVNPLMLTILALIQRSGGSLPHRRIDLYTSVTRTLLDNWNRTRGGKRFADDEIGVAEDVLSVIAFEMHRRDLPLTRQRALELTRASLSYPQDADHISQASAEQFLKTLSESSGLFVERGQGLYGFMHRTFQEYYAARYLLDHKSYAANAPVAVGKADLVAFAVAHYQWPLWREPLLLAVAYKSEQEKRGTRANTIIRAILNAPASCDAILQRHLLFAAACVVDCNFLYLDPALQIEIATRLLDLYGDNLGAGRYIALQREIEEVALLWLRGQPKESNIKTPPLLSTWRAVLCDDDNPQRQEGAAHLLASIAPDLASCPQLVFLELVPPLLQLADVLDIPGIPDEMRARLPDPPARPAHSAIEDYAFVTLRLLDKDGPPGWLHAQWLTWAEAQPELLERLTRHSLELDFLLTPAAFPEKSNDPHWQVWEDIGKQWKDLAQRDLRGLHRSLLTVSRAARYPHAFLYRELLHAEATTGEPWQSVWDQALAVEMERGRGATYQTCLQLRLLLTKDNPYQQRRIVEELLHHLSAPAPLLVQAISAIINIYFIHLMNPKYLRYLRGLIDLKRMRYSINQRELREPKRLRDLIILRYMKDLRNIRNLINLRYLRDLLITLYTILDQGAYRAAALLAIYSVASSLNDVPDPIRQPMEQRLRQLEGRTALSMVQRLLIGAVRRSIGADEPQPTETAPSLPRGTADERARSLDHLKQRMPLSKTNANELFAACYDSRKLSREAWKALTQDKYVSGENTVRMLAWQLLSQPWNMTLEAWQSVIAFLDDEGALMCGAAALVLQKGRDIPPDTRDLAKKRIQAILDDELLSHRPLDPPDGSWLRLDDTLFDALRALAEQG